MAQEPRSKVLYADGNDEQRTYYAGLLRRNYEVVEAETEERALALSKEVDIVVLDIDLKEGNGLNLIGQLLALNSRLPVIIHTIRDAASMHQNTFMTWAADEYVIKQPDGVELMASVRKVNEKRLREKRNPSAAI